MSIIASISIFLNISHINAGAKIEYKAVITDFNEVYNNGYKIINQDGSIYILEKEWHELILNEKIVQ